MGYKSVCINCRIAFNNNANSPEKCLCCGETVILLPHRFRPPSKSNDEEWKTVKFLVQNGFPYQHIYKVQSLKKINVRENYAAYPKTLRDAKEFVKLYEAQSKLK